MNAGKRLLEPGGDVDMVCGLDVCDELHEYSSDTFVNGCEGDDTDEVTGVTLLRDDVAKACMEEMAWFKKVQSLRRGDSMCVKNATQTHLLSMRDVNKGDNERVEVRSRLVGREIKQKGTDNYFARTPPSALVRHVISRAATLSKTGKRRQLMALDGKRAFLHADALTETYVKPPHLRDTERCWLLKKCMYGTLLAAAVRATPCSESWCRRWPAQLKQLSMCVWTFITRFGHGRAW